MEEDEQQEYDLMLAEIADNIKYYFEYKLKPRRHRSIMTKEIEYTWSRRAWKKNS
jgi:hypothetical protein